MRLALVICGFLVSQKSFKLTDILKFAKEKKFPERMPPEQVTNMETEFERSAKSFVLLTTKIVVEQVKIANGPIDNYFKEIT